MPWDGLRPELRPRVRLVLKFFPHIFSAFSIGLLDARGRFTSIGSIFMRRLLKETSTAGLEWLSKS